MTSVSVCVVWLQEELETEVLSEPWLWILILLTGWAFNIGKDSIFEISRRMMFSTPTFSLEASSATLAAAGLPPITEAAWST